MIEIAEVRKRLRLVIDQARKEAAVHRADVERARRAFDAFLSGTAAPLFRQFAQALKVEGHAFQVFTPADSVRLVSDRSPDDYIAIELDTTGHRIAVVGRSTISLGRRVVETEDVLYNGVEIERIPEEDVLEFLLRHVKPFVER